LQTTPSGGIVVLATNYYNIKNNSKQQKGIKKESEKQQ
jgi:hypothetical protein